MHDRRLAQCCCLLGASLLAAWIGGCATARRVNVDPRVAADRLAVGRVRVFQYGQPVGVVKRSWMPGGPMTSLSLRNRSSLEYFHIDIENEEGWFAAELPPGRYSVTMLYYIWMFDTGVQLEIPDDPSRCYLGTLDVALFARWSFVGAWVRGSGGPIPKDDNDVRISDERACVAGYAGADLPTCPMTIAAPPRAAATRLPPSDVAESR
jgi:hypothetical protein